VSRCELVLDHLDAAVAGALQEDLARHVAGCADCQRAVERARALAEGERVLAAVKAPEDLKRRIKDSLRLAPACESAIAMLGAALDGELPEEARAGLLDHMHTCPSCQAIWEAFATLHEVGANTRPPARLRAALAISPRRRVEARRRPRRLFDLRLATAAAYLLAALTVMLLSNPETVARESTYQIDRATTYASAAVENRVQSYSQRFSEAVADAEGWLRDRAQDALKMARSIVGAKTANRKGSSNVVRDGGRS
jgi:hypothetical protein